MNDSPETVRRATGRSSCRLRPPQPRRLPAGFTLIELLIAMAILATLMGLLLPVLGLAQRQARASGTRSVMAKLDVAARLFRADIGSYPYQRSYADPLTSDTWSNRLYWHLGTRMSDAQVQAVRADADAAAARYAVVRAPPNNFAWWYSANGVQLEVMKNRMAAERGRMMIYSGNLDACGPSTQPPLMCGGVAMATGKLVPNPTSSGWADDYLKGELERRHISGEQVLDAWGRPLIYVCQVVEGTFPSYSLVGWDMNIRPLNVGLHTLARTSLAERDAITAKVLDATRPPGLPDLANLRRSDRRFYAAPGYEAAFELWSAGADGQADWMRDAAVNRDNISLVPYDKHLP